MNDPQQLYCAACDQAKPPSASRITSTRSSNRGASVTSQVVTTLPPTAPGHTPSDVLAAFRSPGQAPSDALAAFRNPSGESAQAKPNAAGVGFFKKRTWSLNSDGDS